MKSRLLLAIVFIIMLNVPMEAMDSSSMIDAPPQVSTQKEHNMEPSADTGVEVLLGSYLIIELPSATIQAKGAQTAAILTQFGVVVEVSNVDDIINNPGQLSGSSAVILDGSIGSENATLIPDSFISSLIRSDVPLVLMGHAALLLPRFRDQGPPSLTASIDIALPSTKPAGAVFLSFPVDLTEGASLTDESITLPVNIIQTEHSRIVNLTESSDPITLSPLRYDSWPLDVFLFGPEDPTLLTSDGRGLLLNTIAYASTLRESSTSVILQAQQADPDALLAGGLSYFHEPTIEALYYSVHSAKSALNTTEWTTWRSEHQQLLEDAMTPLYIDLGSEAGFMNQIGGSLKVKFTAMGHWLVNTMSLTSSFSDFKLVTYLSSRQDTNGGFEDHITVTYHVTEALAKAGALSFINQTALSLWLRDCIVGVEDIMEGSYWGGLALNPQSYIPRNSYASHFILSIDMIGESYTDPKIVDWILDHTSNADGSYSDEVDRQIDLVTGTASALTTMEVFGDLSPQNRTNGLDWLEAHQLDSGGFGLSDEDIAGAALPTSTVSFCLETLDADRMGVMAFIDLCESGAGFELVEPLPTMMWTYWLSRASRYSHAVDYIDADAIESYQSLFDRFSQYPQWENMTIRTPTEYDSALTSDQYFDLGVWSQYFGVGTALSSGLGLSASQIADVVSYLQGSQATSGHYRPKQGAVWSPHIQYSVAAVEALYQIDELDTILYRALLEIVLMSEYESGSWDMTDWTLRPFAGTQQAVDWLCTRAALRLGKIDQTKATEIAGVINSRVQYDDLWALSCDVATLTLLNSSFSVDLESINATRVQESLESEFSNGWFNSSGLWQPVFTTDILHMVSILGLRATSCDVSGLRLQATVASDSRIGDTLSISVTIESGESTHNVYVHAFGTCFNFNNVANTDTLEVSVPSTVDWLGISNISLMVWDYGASRAYDLLTITTQGSLSGSLIVDNPHTLIGDKVNGTVSWTLSTGEPAGPSNVSIRLGDGVTYYEWFYTDETSPFSFSVPTDDFTGGDYNLTATVNRTWCDSLTLLEPVFIEAPTETYLTAPSVLQGVVGTVVNIDWSLRVLANDSLISSQLVLLEVQNSTGHVVHGNSQTSILETSTFQWIPGVRGGFTFDLTFERNGSLEGSKFTGTIDVFENTSLTWINNGTHYQYTTVTLDVLLTTEEGIALDGKSVSVSVTSPSLQTVFDSTLTTNSTGYVSLTLQVDENGQYALSASFAGEGFLEPSLSNSMVTSWSSSTLTSGGITSEALVSETSRVWARLLDSNGSVVQGELVTIKVILLPSTTVIDQTTLTNGTGHAYVDWTPDLAGSYRIEVWFNGHSSRGSAYDEMSVEARIPLTLFLDTVSFSTVGSAGWIEVTVRDHTGSPVAGITVTVNVLDRWGSPVFTDSGVTSGGLLNVTWTPTVRGPCVINATTLRQSWYERANTSLTLDVFDSVEIGIEWTISPMAITLNDLQITVLDSGVNAVSGVQVHTIVVIESITVLDLINFTDESGVVLLSVLLDNLGNVTVTVDFIAQDWLLATSNHTTTFVMGITTLEITPHSQPISQGSTMSLVATLTDWSGVALVGHDVTLTVEYPNGTLTQSSQLITGAGGSCAMAHDFNTIGDFIVRAQFAGEGMNAPAEDYKVRRVYTIPSFIVTVSPTSLLGATVSINVTIYDAFGIYIPERTLTLTIIMEGSTVFESQFLSEAGPKTIHWNPLERGLATITVHHAPDAFYFENSTAESLSVLEVVSGSIQVEPTTVNLFESTNLTYTLTAGGDALGVEIVFEVLRTDLIVIWTDTILTNGSGIATVLYTADDAYGNLYVRAGPSDNQFLVGGDEQTDLVIRTDCNTVTMTVPEIATLGSDVTFEIQGTDDLGQPIHNLDVRVGLFDPFGQPIKLGLWNNNITLTLIDGYANFTFTPQYAGSHSLGLESSGSQSVNSFYEEGIHIVHSPTDIQLLNMETSMWVGDTITITSQLRDFSGDPLSGLNVEVYLDGPGSLFIGPVTLATNSTGHVQWDATIPDEGLWHAVCEFDGVGVYLSSTDAENIDARYGTSLSVSILTIGEVVAGDSLDLSVLLSDSAETPLEGFTIRYEVYHNQYGLLQEGFLTQTGQLPENVSLVMDRMGNHTIVFLFDGTVHYHSSNLACSVFVKGTTEIGFTGELEYERTTDEMVEASVHDELGAILDLSDVEISVKLTGPSGAVTIEDRLNWTVDSICMNLLGLAVGTYTLSVNVQSSPLRLGCSGDFQFNMTTASKLTGSENDLSGIVNTAHSIAFLLTDSLNESIDEASLWVSLYAPDGKEIYGSPLKDRTEVSTEGGMIEVRWTPSSSGNYTILVVFEGLEMVEGTQIEMIVLTRRAVQIEASHEEVFTFGDVPEFVLTVTGGLDRLSGVEVNMTVIVWSSVVRTEILETDYRGKVTATLEDLLAGEYDIVFTFQGDEVYASCTRHASFIVKPNVVIRLGQVISPFVNVNATITVLFDVLGMNETWTGNTSVRLNGPDDIWEWIREVGPSSNVLFHFIPTEAGTYALNVTLSSLPVIGGVSEGFEFEIVVPPPELPMDSGTVPVVSGGLALGGIAALLRKKMRRLLDSLPAEWEG